ncbi:MAG: insulinase family protein, partial [Alphaproteobacteria bacterium]|nr:insulinase family protein [Alphaproteobacteria bacterium]
TELDAEVEQARADTGSKLADSIAEAVAIRETVASPQVARDVFGALQGKISPQDIVKSTQRLFSGVGPRLLMSTAKPFPDGVRQLEAALTAPVKLVSSKVDGQVSFAQLPVLGPPGKIISVVPVAHDTMKIVTFENGVRALLLSLDGASGRVFVSARFGRGRLAMPKDKPTVAFAGSGALVASGIGKLGLNELDTLMNGKLVGMSLQIDDDAFALRSQTDAANLPDELRLLATKLAYPRWDAAPVERARAAMLAEQAGVDASPAGLLGNALDGLLTSDDPRFSSPTRAQIEALTPASFKDFWAPQLAAGPIELLIVGDFKEADAIKAAQATFGALPARTDEAVSPASSHLSGPTPALQRRIDYHRGDANQSAALLAWPVGHVGATSFEEHKLDVLAAIFNQRLFDKLREAAGEAYSPRVDNNWRHVFPEGSSIEVVAQLKPASVDSFFKIARGIAADLVAHPVSVDEFQRALQPMEALVMRAFNSELFWLNDLGGATTNQNRIQEIVSMPAQLKAITPADIQDMARTYLKPGNALEYAVLPRPKAKR